MQTTATYYITRNRPSEDEQAVSCLHRQVDKMTAQQIERSRILI